MEKYGFKCFNKDMTNRYGKKFEIGLSYFTEGDVQFGIRGNGFHFCENFEDSFRYFPAMEEEISLCSVKGYGDICKRDDEYYGYYDMFCASNIEILKKFSRDEIIQMALQLNSLRICRFIQLFKLKENEKIMILEKYKNDETVLFHIEFYQNHKVLKKVYDSVQMFRNL